MAKEQYSKILSLLSCIKQHPLSEDQIKESSIRLAGYLVDAGAHEAKILGKKQRSFFSNMSKDLLAKSLLGSILDLICRDISDERMADQLSYLFFQFGIPRSFPIKTRFALLLVKLLGKKAPSFFIPLVKKTFFKSLDYMIKSTDEKTLNSYLLEKQKEHLIVVPFLVGDRVIGEQHAEKKLHDYLSLLKNPLISSIGVNPSHLYSQFHLFNFEKSLSITLARLRKIFQAAFDSEKKTNKQITLLIENYPTFLFNIELFKTILNEEEFHSFSAGIILQSYLPEALEAQKELTKWAQERIKANKSPIQITLVKGSYLGMEGINATKNNRPQATYLTKVETDANYKKMVRYGLTKENLKACHLAIGTHNVFDIAYCMVLCSSLGITSHVTYAMLEGRTIYNRKVLEQLLTGQVSLFPPLYSPDNPSESITYYFQRIHDARSEETYLFHAPTLTSSSKGFEQLADLFSESLDGMDSVSNTIRSTQSFLAKPILDLFDNQEKTDLSHSKNRIWTDEVIGKAKDIPNNPLPLLIEGNEIYTNTIDTLSDLDNPEKTLCQYCMAEEKEIERALNSVSSFQSTWQNSPISQRITIMKKVSSLFKEDRANLIARLMADGAKTFLEADEEISQAIDSIEYSCIRLEKLFKMKDIVWKPKGTALVISGRGIPFSVTTVSIVSNLLSGNTVLFKPAPKTILSGFYLVSSFFKAELPKEALQFIPTTDSLTEKKILTDPRINLALFAGHHETAKKMISLNPYLHIEATTGGKNCMIISDVSDFKLAIQDLIDSAFGYSGQKKSCSSLAILLEDVYNNPRFMEQLIDATQSLTVGSCLKKDTKIVPLSHKPQGKIYHVLTKLEEGEEWVLKPEQNPQNPRLWSPGIKKGVQRKSLSHTHILPAPILFLMKAKNFEEALQIASDSPFGLTAGIHTLDRREQALWQKTIEAGNLYINHNMTHCVIRRRPYGGCKGSSFGKGLKPGGPNFLTVCMEANQNHLPKEKLPVNEKVNNLTSFLEAIDLTAEELGIWYASVANYAYWWKRMRQPKDPSKLIGEDNFFRYVPLKKLVLRITKEASVLDSLRVCAAALTCSCDLEISYSSKITFHPNWQKLSHLLHVVDEPENAFLEKVKEGKFAKIRLLSSPSKELFLAASISSTFISKDPVLANGRLELLHYLREESTCHTFHRYGDMGVREEEMRKPLY